jgi:hypothetical protein
MATKDSRRQALEQNLHLVDLVIDGTLLTDPKESFIGKRKVAIRGVLDHVAAANAYLLLTYLRAEMATVIRREQLEDSIVALIQETMPSSAERIAELLLTKRAATNPSMLTTHIPSPENDR